MAVAFVPFNVDSISPASRLHRALGRVLLSPADLTALSRIAKVRRALTFYSWGWNVRGPPHGSNSRARKKLQERKVFCVMPGIRTRFLVDGRTRKLASRRNV